MMRIGNYGKKEKITKEANLAMGIYQENSLGGYDIICGSVYLFSNTIDILP